MSTASDNVSAAVAGGLGAVQDLLSKYIEGKINTQNADYLAQRNSDRELAQKQSLMPLQWQQEQRKLALENQNKLGQISAQSSADLSRKQAELNLPVATYNETTGEAGLPTTFGAKKLSESDSSKFNSQQSNIDLREAYKQLSNAKKDALPQKTNLQKINQALDLINNGVTGKGGQAKAFLAPYAEMMGIDSKNLNDAQTFQLLTRSIVGPMRLDIVGPGQVSNYEQELMKQISGGGGTAKNAANELLNYYKKTAEGKVKNYNDLIESSKTLSPAIEKLYKPVQLDNPKTVPSDNPINASDLKVGGSFGGGTIKAIRWK